MPRGLRDTTAGVFHVTSHGVRATPLYLDDLDRMRFLRELARVNREDGWTCIGFCLMRTHYHLIVQVSDDTLPRAMHALNFRYAGGFNARHGTRGHVFERRYYAGRLETRSHLLYAYRYVVRNPVTAGLCVMPAEWPWSSYGATIGHGDVEHSFVDAGRVLAELADGETDAVARLRELVEL
ncbi:MAG: transposase [Actinomycetota bacterium]